MSTNILVASSNQGKIKEIKDKLKEYNFKIFGLNKFPDLVELEEDGSSFEENALKKARTRARETGFLTLADDSGLEVDFLGGEPGIYSARYAGLKATDEANNQKLRTVLANVPRSERTARFRCVMAFVDPENGEEIVTEGRCEGAIVLEPRGKNGFGYDPLFYVPEYDKTMAELPLEIKNNISHRARALNKMVEEIIQKYY